MKLQFKAEDFFGPNVPPMDPKRTYPEQLAERANARLAEMLAEAAEVRSDRSGQWDESWEWDSRGPYTHRARLVEIEELKS